MLKFAMVPMMTVMVRVDEGLIRRCSSAGGGGVEECNAGQWVSCDAVQPEPEICDTLDT